MSTQAPIVIVGAGHSGAKAAAALRKHGWQGGIVLIGEEAQAPYDRPPLSKAVLLGKKLADQCLFYPQQWYQDQGVDLLLQARATAVDRHNFEVVVGGGRRIAYHRLLLATGARHRQLQVPGSDLHGVWPLRTPEHANAIARALQPQGKVVVVGAGVIGLEVAAAAAELHCNVVVLEAADRAMGRSLPVEASAALLKAHRARGVDVRLSVRVMAIEGDGHVRQVRLSTGETIGCSVVVHGLGVQPNIELAQQAGLATADGIRTDWTLRTADERIFACGDACEYDSTLYGRPLRLENWRNAEDQADLVARNMLGEALPYNEVPWFWSNQFDLSIQMAGLHTASDRVEVEQVGASSLFRSLGCEGAVRAVCGIGAVRDVALPVRNARASIRARLATDRPAIAA